MEKIGTQKIWSFFDAGEASRRAPIQKIRAGNGHVVSTYFELAMKVAELQFLNRDYVLLFRGQSHDHKSTEGVSVLKPSMFRVGGSRLLNQKALQARFERLRSAEVRLVRLYRDANFRGSERLARHRILKWAILQHYEVCRTPLLDVTQSLRISASFAAGKNMSGEAYLYVLGVPNRSGAVTASSESGLQIICLSSACPPEAVRPHMQEGFLLGEYPEVADYDRNSKYSYDEMDFSRRLIAKFRLNLKKFWDGKSFPAASVESIYPKKQNDPLLELANQIKSEIGPEVDT